MLKETDQVVLMHDLPNLRLAAGDLGTVVRVLEDRAGYDVEFKTLAGESVAVTTLVAVQFRPVGPRDIARVRKLDEL